MAVSRSPEALVRTALGLSQAQLARFLGVAAPVLAHYEAGRRLPPAAVAERLLPLARLLPPPLGSGLPETVLPAPDPDPDAVVWWLALPAGTSAGVPEPVRRRVRDCRLLALGLHQQLARLQGRATGLAHRRRGLERLAALPTPPAPLEAARLTRWLAGLVEDLALADPDPVGRATSQRLLAARLAGLRAEVLALLP